MTTADKKKPVRYIKENMIQKLKIQHPIIWNLGYVWLEIVVVSATSRPR